jgi:hypothetical protein
MSDEDRPGLITPETAEEPAVPEVAQGALGALQAESAALMAARVELERMAEQNALAAEENAKLRASIEEREQARQALEVTLEKIQSQPGPGNSRGGLVRDTGPPELEVRRSTLSDRSPEGIADRVRLQAELADAFRTGHKVRFVHDTAASQQGERTQVLSGPQYTTKKVEHPATGGLPGWVEYLSKLVGKQSGKSET